MLFLVYLSQKKKDKSWLEFESIEFFQELSRASISPSDLEHLRKTCNIYHSGISTIFPTDIQHPPNYKPSWNEKELADELQVLSSLSPDFHYSTLKLEMVTLVPPVLEIGEDEFQFLDTEEEQDLLLSPINQFLHVSPEKFQLLQQKALTEPISSEELHQLTFALKDNPKLLKAFPFTTDQILQLLNNNWSVASEFIIVLHQIHQDFITHHHSQSINGNETKQSSDIESKPSTDNEESSLMDFLHLFLEIEISTHSLEAIHAVCKKTDLPSEFLRKYLLRAMEFCSKTKEASVQNRYVRAVCGLIQSILRKNPKPISSVIVELQAFCLSFTHVKDAIVLYAMAKGIDSK